VIYNLIAEIQTLRLEAKNYLNMFEKESHNHIEIFLLRVVPSIEKKMKIELKNQTIKRITPKTIITKIIFT